MRLAEDVVALRLEFAGQLRRFGTDGGRRWPSSPGRRERTNRPIAWAKNNGVEGTGGVDAHRQAGHVDTPDTMRTATSQRLVPSENWLIRSEEPGSSDSTTVGASPVIVVNNFAYARAAV